MVRQKIYRISEYIPRAAFFAWNSGTESTRLVTGEIIRAEMLVILVRVVMNARKIDAADIMQ